MKWTDISEIAIALADTHIDVDPLKVRFTDLRQYVLAIDGFEDVKDGCNEKILEAIQMAWLDEI